MIALENHDGIADGELEKALFSSVEGKKAKKVLLLPPDFTRMYSYAGKITALYYNMLKDVCEVDVMPALGTHEPMTKAECEAFFCGAVPYEKLIIHNWRTDVVKIGEVPAAFVESVSEGLVKNKIDVEVNKIIAHGGYDLIISVGQVVPHEVVGMANYSKNIFVGCGGKAMINSSHMLGAFYGLERIMGEDYSPVRKVFDYAEEHFLGNIPIMYVLTVTVTEEQKTKLCGLFVEEDVCKRGRESFNKAVCLSRKLNINHVEKRLSKVIVYLDPLEFKSTWLGNKAVYRTRMAIKDGGELIIIAPGIKKFGEDAENDRLIRKYGYRGRLKVLETVKESRELGDNLSVAAHLIHGSSDGRFKIVYAAPKLGKAETEGVGYDFADIDEVKKKYDPDTLKDGINVMADGEEVFYISNPALGLWKAEK